MKGVGLPTGGLAGLQVIADAIGVKYLLIVGWPHTNQVAVSPAHRVLILMPRPAANSLNHKGIGVKPRHRLARVIAEATTEPMFAAQWFDDSDESFRPFAAAVLNLRNATRLEEGARRAIYRDICLRKRVSVLAEIVGEPVPARVLKLLTRTNWQDFSRRDWHAFFSIATEDGNFALGQVPQITSTLVRQFPMIPEDLRLPGLLGIAGNLQLPAERWAQWRGFIHQADANQRARFRRAAGVVASRGDFWDLYFRCEGKYWLPFSIPASLRASPLLEPIASPVEMVAEALRMKNCLANRISRVQSGNRVIFRPRDGSPINAELVRQGATWVPGAILGYENSPVTPKVAQSIEAELQRLGKSVSVPDDVAAAEVDAYVGKLRQIARETFAAEEIASLASPLQAIQAKSESWSNGAFAIFELEQGGYVQFMSSPDGKEYLLEICSHNYDENVSEVLTADAVAIIEWAGFVWPNGMHNFKRWFSISSPEDIRAMAELTLAILAGVFGLREGGCILIDTHIPA